MEDNLVASLVTEDTSEHTSSDHKEDNDSTNDTQDSTNFFSATYVPELPAHGLTVLPEDIPVKDFETPSIEVTNEGIDPLQPLSNSGTANTFSPNHIATNGLSPSIPSSPGHRRRSSAGGHRRKSSARSLVGLGIAVSPELRQRTSISSNPGDFEDFQDGDEGSDFGDFDDFEEGEFDASLEDNLPEPLYKTEPESPVAQSQRTFPDLRDEDGVKTYTRVTLTDLLLISGSTEQDKGESSNHENDDHNTEEAESEEEDESPFMLTDRAVSLWKQLTAPPPLQPPDWKRSRIRRLFLVSLGIPVDLDEILPKMTHKKLVLPSTRRHKDKKTADERRSRKKIPPPPDFEITAARQLCSTTREAISAMSERDLEIHVTTLRAHTAAASGLLTYWLEQREAAQSEKDTFEQVVSNLVQYHKKQKNEQREKTTNAAKKSRSRFSMRG